MHELPLGSRQSKGRAIVNLLPFRQDETVRAVVQTRDFGEAKYLVFATKNGIVKKTALSEYDSPRTGLAAINLRPGDELIDVQMTTGTDDILLMSRKGQAIRFAESTARAMGRQTGGVIGMRLAEADEVIAMGRSSAGEEVISVSEGGYGKRTALPQYPRKGRGGKGVVSHKLTSRTGQVAGAFVGSKEQDLFVINSDGIVIRVPASDIRRVGRISQGVRTMKVQPGSKVVAIAPVVMQMEDEA